jgi:hypothetical protein
MLSPWKDSFFSNTSSGFSLYWELCRSINLQKYTPISGTE